MAKSKFVNEIISELENSPDNYYCAGYEISHRDKNIKIRGYGNSRVLSIIDVDINSTETPILYSDKWSLEVAIKKWFKSSGVNRVLKKH